MAEEEKDDTCPICLSPCVNSAYPSSCGHNFCLECIQKWQSTTTSAMLVCPMCKRESSSLQYNYDASTKIYDLYFFDKNIKCIVLSKAHRTRLQFYMVEKSVTVSKMEEVKRFWSRYRFRQPNPYIVDWLKRELQALTRVEDTHILAQYINSIVERFCSRHYKNEEEVDLSKEFKELVSSAASKFVTAAKQFAEELELFLASKLNIQEYDLAAERQKSLDDEMHHWIQQNVNMLQPQNANEFLISGCLKLAKRATSHGMLGYELVGELGFTPNSETYDFARRLFNKLSNNEELDQTCNMKHEERKKKVYVQDANMLHYVGAFDKDENLNSFGIMMVELEVVPLMAVMIESSKKQGCVEEILKIAAMMSSRANAHQTEVSRSDHVSMLVAYESWEAANFSKQWCLDNGVQLKKMEHAKLLIHKWDKTLESLGIKVTSKRDIQCIKKCVVEGYVSTCAKFQGDGTYKSLKAPHATKRIDPTSTLYESYPMPLFVIHSDTFNNSSMKEVTEITVRGLSKEQRHQIIGR